MSVHILEGDCRSILPTLPARSVQCCVTSPPYWSLRSYLSDDHPAKAHEIGQESTPQEYIQTLVEVFRLVWRVLCENGTLWLNLGDTHADTPNADFLPDAKPKDLLGLPWRTALALQADGWHLRDDIIWHKPNPKPESVKDRTTRAHEYLFLLSKREEYYYDIDATREPVTSTGGASFGKQRYNVEGTKSESRRLASPAQRSHPLGKNKRSVWTVPPRPVAGIHVAAFPPELITPCILAGCPPQGTVLDPFGGSGTTGHVAESLKRNAILIELHPVYVAMQQQRSAIQDVLTPGSKAMSDEKPRGSSSQRPPLPHPRDSGWLWEDV